MKWSYIQMSLLIQGPRQPRNDIDVFLEPVIVELVEMFEKGVTDEEDYRGYQKMHPFGANVPLPIFQEAVIVDAPKDS